MFGSQALEVAIGLSLVFFILAIASSTVLETISRLMSKRASDLEKIITEMVEDPQKLYETSVFTTLEAGAGKSVRTHQPKKPSYVSAKAFADATVEMMVNAKAAASGAQNIYDELPDPLRTRVRTIVAEVGNDLTKVKAGIESWFDSTMERAEGGYKRWAMAWLFFIGLGVTIFANAGAYRMAESMWTDPVVREAVVAAADSTVQEGDAASEITSVNDAVEELDSLQLPVGWDAEMRDRWRFWTGDFWTEDVDENVATLGGWLATALLLTLGAPFWFDLLTKLVSLRSAGTKPMPAQDDSASATTTIRLETISGPPPPAPPPEPVGTRGPPGQGDELAAASTVTVTHRHQGDLINALVDDA